VNLLRSPLDTLSWFSIWLMVYLLFVARLRPDPFVGRMYFPLVSVNEHLGGPSFFVMPNSLLASWLALRPAALQRKWRPLAIIVLLMLISLTAYFLVLMGNRPFKVTVASFVEQEGILGTGPLLILAGGVVLLGAEYVGTRRDRTRAAAREGATRRTATGPRRVNKVGFWSALLASASSVTGIVLSLFEAYSPVMQRYDQGVYSLIEGLKAGAAVLIPISFVVLMACISRSAPPEKKIWARVGLLLAVVYAFMHLVNAYLYLLFSRSSPQVYGRVATSYPILLSLGAMSFAFLSLALLLALPVFRRGGIERVVRWCFVLLVLLECVSGLGYLLSSARLPILAMLPNLIAQSVVFPVAMALVAVAFRRRESQDERRGA